MWRNCRSISRARSRRPGLTPADIEEIVVGIGPAPFTGLRAGIVAAKALAFATGAKLVGQNVLDPQGEMMNFVLGDSAMFDGIDFRPTCRA